MNRYVKAVGILAGLGFVGAGCAHGGAESQQQNPVVASQEQSHQALRPAADAQKKANDQEQKAEQAQSHVDQLKRELAQAQMDAVHQRQLAQQMQQQAIEENQRAQRASSMLQQQAMMAQQQQAEQAQSATTQVAGTVTRAGNREVDIARAQDQQPLKLSVTSDTQVTLNGQPTNAGAIAPGTPVRVSYRPGMGLPEAVRIDAGIVSPENAGVPNPQDQSSQQGSTQPQQQQTNP